MIRWTCQQCGSSGLYMAEANQAIACRDCRASAVVKYRGWGKNRMLVVVQKRSAAKSVATGEWRLPAARSRKIVGLCAIGCAVVYGLVFVVQHGSAWRRAAGAINDMNDKNVAEAIGLLVPTYEITRPDGKVVDKPVGTGSCFQITSDGVLLTNRHVVEDASNFSNAPGKATLEKALSIRIVVRFWVFFAGRQFEAKVLHLDVENDYAVLKVDREENKPYFRLAAASDVQRGSTIYALGFPGLARVPLSDQEERENLVKEVLAETVGSSVKQYFKTRDYEYVQTCGSVSRITAESRRRWIEHDAAIAPGSSGGPLLTGDGRVIGINTQIALDRGGSLGYALTFDGLKEQIGKYAQTSCWE